jgi:glutamine---fructose-6-phosphate transaminase (isomerizing)
MCGIVGYVGTRDAQPILVNGLRRLEYRGYDSAGVATIDDGEIHFRRSVGKVSDLEGLLSTSAAPGPIGLAHTRWATHGGPSEKNAHPHLDASGRIAIVHNGIIENHGAIRQFLEKQGTSFLSETDTESLAQLIGFFYEQTGDFLASVRQAVRDVRGTFGLVVLCKDVPHTLVAARRGSPLIVGIGDGEFVVASDGSAIAEHTHRVVYLEDNELVTMGPDGLQVTDLDQKLLEKEVDTLEVTLEEIELAGHEHHMHKEIHEQPESLRNAMSGRINLDDGQIHLGGLSSLDRDLPHVHRILLTGCGTAWHAGLIGEYLFEELARIPTDVEYASELRYRNPIVEEGTIAIALSQSGETADTLAALREVRMKGATGLGVVNVVGSTIARETDAGVYLHVGAEIGVASTKAFTAQVAVLAMIATSLGRRRDLSSERTLEVMNALGDIPGQVEVALKTEDQIKSIAEWIITRDNCLYLGRGVNYPAALEGALKLKEVSYIHAEGMPAAEMKHGPIALIDEGMPVIVVAPKDHTFDKVLANIEEVRGRGGRVVAVTTEGTDELDGIADDVVKVPSTLPILSPLLTSIPLQLLAYHAALLRGQDVDKPRNLAKSVTVE